MLPWETTPLKGYLVDIIYIMDSSSTQHTWKVKKIVKDSE